jgi:hypothetical protein
MRGVTGEKQNESKTVCAWCEPGFGVRGVSHGICRGHFRRLRYKIRGSKPKVVKLPLIKRNTIVLHGNFPPMISGGVR